MNTVIDIGNTTIAIGLSKDGKTIDKVYRLNTEKNRSYDEYGVLLKDFIPTCSAAMISSVVPELNEVFREYFENHCGVTPLFLGQGVKTGIQIMSDNPKEVGADLIGNTVAATSLYDETCLIIDLGTATTFTYVEKKILKGVIISTGLTTSKDALINKASLLPQIELTPPKKLLGTNSADCIKSGLLYGHASMIDGMIRRIKEEVHNQDLTVILTGGHAKIVYPLTQEKMIKDEILILKGLLLVIGKNFNS
ncbi:MAG: type III pantothenate kinase [Bacilli bacterium]|nr:type III pantothenate kinase [Bacilli bacterium]MBN2877760.1 type III pantothenate kinase [Bacilli bacterium]